jgi:hypothetical protein
MHEICPREPQVRIVEKTIGASVPLTLQAACYTSCVEWLLRRLVFMIIDSDKTHTGICVVVKLIAGNYQSYLVIINNYQKKR